MNKFLLSIIAIASIMLLVSCGDKGPDTVEAKPAGETAEAAPMSAVYMVDPGQSSIAWVGRYQIGPKMHTGLININSGMMSVEAGRLLAGTVTVDMNSISLTDQTSEGGKAKLLVHLKSDAFFSTEQYPTASFTLTSVKPAPKDSAATHFISGNLSLRGVTKEITIPAKVAIQDNFLKASSNFALNRADFNVTYGSPTHILDIAKDDIINDNIELKLRIVANKKEAAGTN